VKEFLKEEEILQIEEEIATSIQQQFKLAVEAEEPEIKSVADHVFIPTPIHEETGQRTRPGKEKVLMVDAALYAIRELMEEHEECILFGQDVGFRLGGVFREAATLADQFGRNRVFNTGIQEAYIIGSTVGLSATGVKPIVEIQFADYIYPGFNQLVSELSKVLLFNQWKIPCFLHHQNSCRCLWWRRAISQWIYRNNTTFYQRNKDCLPLKCS
jgi:2-oxoisovalerate dehydrogenase E1 component